MKEYTLKEKTVEFLNTDMHRLLINGKEIISESEAVLTVVNPSTEEIIGNIPVASSVDVGLAVDAAYNSFNSGAWKNMYPNQRERLLNNLADALEEEHEIIAEILTLETGKLYAQAKSEIMGAVATFRYYAGWATKMEGETIDISLKQKPGKQNFAFTKRQPVGPVAAIVPWNFPISIASWKLAPALAAGCTIVLKPSEVAPLSTLYFSRLFAKVGFPDGVVNVITGDGTTGAALTKNPKIAKITFTGSTQVGKLIGKAAMDNMTGISLELGGKSPGLIFEDCDKAAAAKGIAMGIFRNSGQVCVAGSRVYIHKNIFDEVLADICAEGSKMKISHGFDPEADIGPLVSKSHWENVTRYIELGQSEGATLCSGGTNPKEKGYYLEPTVFSAENNNKTIIQEEIFGPVLVAVPFSTTEEAIQLANNSVYGLSSTVWTNNLTTAMTCVDSINAGWVFVNSPARSDPNFPLGGNKQSGNARELGKTGLYNYTKLKAVNIVF